VRTLLHVHHGTAPGGAPLSLLRLLTRLDRTRFRSIVALPGEGPLAAEFRDAGLEVLTGPVAPLYALAQAGPTLRNRLRHRLVAPFERGFLARLVVERRPDVVHLNTALLPTAAAAAARAGAPVLVHVREVVPTGDRFAARRIIAPVRRNARRIVAISEAAAAPFRGVDGPPVEVVHEGVDLESFDRPGARATVRAALGAAPDDIVLLVPAVLLPAKGQAVLIEALRELRTRTPRLLVWMAGAPVDSGYAARLERDARAAAPAEAVRWLGHRTDVPDLLAGADIALFLPAAAEGFGLPLVEAMAAGRPVVGPDHGASREILSDGVEGHLIDPADPGALVRVVSELAESPALRERLGEAGRRRARADFDLSGMVRRFEALYEATAAG
jgi:glycosyltransferase involved in cell wall biosynthesis